MQGCTLTAGSCCPLGAARLNSDSRFAPASSALQDKPHVLLWPQPFPELQQQAPCSACCRRRDGEGQGAGLPGGSRKVDVMVQEGCAAARLLMREKGREIAI